MGHHPVTKISDDELQRLADLAQLSLPSGPARQKLGEQLGEVLAYVSSVQSYQPVVPDVGTQNFSSPQRPDVAQPDPLGQSWLQQSPLAEGQLVAVPGLFANHGADAE
jgi:Asp-tRNA(Asn)/Glu-tRNA(Gln) amidotransferase C subunit